MSDLSNFTEACGKNGCTNPRGHETMGGVCSTPQPEVFPFIAVIGRIPYDDEDSVLSFRNMTRAEAMEAFAVQMYEDSGKDDPGEEDEDGERIYINHVLASQSEITIE